MNFEEFWDNVNAYTSPAIRKHFSDHAVKLLQALLLETFKWDSVDIGVCLDGKKTYSMITHDQWNSDKQLSLRLHPGGRFDLYFECYEEDDYASAVYELTDQDALLIPERLKKLMEKARKTRKPIGANKNTLQSPP